MIDYSTLIDDQVKEIRSHWRSDARLTRGPFDYVQQLEAIEQEYKRRFG